MKKFTVLLSAALILMASCQDNDVVAPGNGQNETDAIEFSNYVTGMTRASRAKGKSFVDGDKMEVWGFQTTDGNTLNLFNNQQVDFDGTKWTYTPPKYWNAGSSYDFYAMFPYSASNAFDLDSRMFSYQNFTVADAKDDQVDIMIAKRKEGITSHNVVDMEFNHILSNVNFYIRSNANLPGIKSVDVVSFDIEGLNSKGSYKQSTWTAEDNAFGAWNVDKASVYDFPVVQNVTYTVGDTKPQKLEDDLLLMPQDIAVKAKVTVHYILNYTDNTQQEFERSASLHNIVGVRKSTQASEAISSWQPGYKYIYTLILDPSKTNGDPTADVSHDDGHHEPDVDIIVIPDTDGDGEDEYWVDEDGDGIPDYPLVWEDDDNDGWENLYPDHDGDGIPDYRDPDYTGGDSDGDGDPDDAWVDTDGDGYTDTEIKRPTPTVGPDVPTDPTDPNYPDKAFIDYDGGAGEGYLKPEAFLETDEDGEYWVVVKDEDGNEIERIHVLWKDIDGDGKLEGIADKDGDGKLTPADTYDGDGKDYKDNPNDYDVIMIDTDGDGTADTELEKTVTNPDVPTPSSENNIIEFSATVLDWVEEYEADVDITQ